MCTFLYNGHKNVIRRLYEQSSLYRSGFFSGRWCIHALNRIWASFEPLQIYFVNINTRAIYNVHIFLYIRIQFFHNSFINFTWTFNLVWKTRILLKSFDVQRFAVCRLNAISLRGTRSARDRRYWYHYKAWLYPREWGQIIVELSSNLETTLKTNSLLSKFYLMKTAQWFTCAESIPNLVFCKKRGKPP